MPLTRTADVIVVAGRLTPSDIGWIKRLVERSEGALNRLLLFTGPISDPAVLNLAQSDPRIVFLPQSDNPGDVEACNRGFAERAGDAALLPQEASVSPGWLAELCSAAASEERTAFSWPLSSENSNLAQAELDVERSTGMAADLDFARECTRGLPRFTSTSSVHGDCVYLRGQNLDAIGLFDGSLSTTRDAIDDWVMRAQALGFFGKRANHAFVQGPPREPADTDAHSPLECDRSVLEARHPHLSHQIESFRQGLDGSLARHAFEFQRTGRLKVAYDIRHLPPENVGTRTYAIELAAALGRLKEVELSFLVNTPAQAEGLDGPVIKNEEWRDEFAVIHRPAQFFKRQELEIPFSSAAHVVVTYQDLIAYRVPAVFHADADYDAYRTTSALSLLCASGILAYSQSSLDEIAAEFGIDRAEIALTPLAVDSASFARRDPADHLIRRDLALPDRYFFSLATDYPHKNLAGLLEAYAELRNRSSGTTPPALVLAGYALAARAKVQGGFDSDSSRNGVFFLGPVSPDELRVLYQNAEALVYPSLYEGFGLPPLEAMAAGHSGHRDAVFIRPGSRRRRRDLFRRSCPTRSGAGDGAGCRIGQPPRQPAGTWSAASRAGSLGKNGPAHVRGLPQGGVEPDRAGPGQAPNVARGDPPLVAARCAGARNGSRGAVARRADPGGPQRVESAQLGDPAASRPRGAPIPALFGSQTGLTMTISPGRSNLDKARG